MPQKIKTDSIKGSSPIGGPLYFEGDLTDWKDRYNHGMDKAVPYYECRGSLFSWNEPDGHIDSYVDPDNVDKYKFNPVLTPLPY